MKETFRWNPYADQPHNVAPKSERLKHHLRYWHSYLSLAALNGMKLFPGLKRYRAYKRQLFQCPAAIDDPFALSFTPSRNRNRDILECFQDLGLRQGLFRIPSWELDRLDFFEESLDFFRSKGIEIVLALLQQRDDLLKPEKWRDFLNIVFSRFGKKCPYFEIGHAWNRTKWGIWDYKEYIKLAKTARQVSREYEATLIGPAVIDFEFHLYPPVLRQVTYDIVSSLLYTDRVGAPENRQYGWDLPHKIALLRATVDVCANRKKELWVTEFNWPLQGTGKYSPASGKPNVSEEEQADFMARYYLLSLATGHVRRIYWWQLAAPGYGLIDTRQKTWRKRPAYAALKTLIGHCRKSRFLEKIPHPSAWLFLFEKAGKTFAVCWTTGADVEHRFSLSVDHVVSRDGDILRPQGSSILITGSPQYVHFRPHGSP